MAQDASTETAEQRRASTRADLRALASKSTTVAASIIRLLCAVFAAILVIHVVLFVAAANPANEITQFFARTSSGLTLGFGTLFVPVETGLNTILNYGIAAIVWLVIGFVVSRILSALAP